MSSSSKEVRLIVIKQIEEKMKNVDAEKICQVCKKNICYNPCLDMIIQQEERILFQITICSSMEGIDLK